MGSWIEDLGIEEARIRLVYKLLYGFVIEDIRKLRIPGDIRTTMKRDLEIKGWFRNGLLPLETWSVLEGQKLGWAWDSNKVTVWFVRAETEEAISIPLENIKSFMITTKQPVKESLKCKCGAKFWVSIHSHPTIIKQALQWSNHGEGHKYHSACLFVKPEAFEIIAKLSSIRYTQSVFKEEN